MRAAVTIGSPTTSAGQRHSSDTPTSESSIPRSAIISVALGRNEQILISDNLIHRRTPSSPAAARSLCESCAFVRHVHGKRGQRYLLCTNEAIDVKYPPQPVGRCEGYEPVSE